MSARFAALAASVAAGLFGAGPATAQDSGAGISEAKRAEMLCVYEKAIEDFDLYLSIADSYLVEGDVARDSEDGKKLVAFTADCTAKYGWETERAELASAMAIVGASADIVELEDLFDMTEEQIGAIFVTIDEISDEDYAAFESRSWEEDTLMARVTALLKKNGFPADQDDAAYSGMLLMEVNIVGLALIEEWIARFGK